MLSGLRLRGYSSISAREEEFESQEWRTKLVGAGELTSRQWLGLPGGGFFQRCGEPFVLKVWLQCFLVEKPKNHECYEDRGLSMQKREEPGISRLHD